MGLEFFDLAGQKYGEEELIMENVVSRGLTVGGNRVQAMEQMFRDLSITFICDNRNPTVGPKGATYTFGP